MMTASQKLALNLTWSWPGTAFLLILIMFPLFGPVMPTIDGNLFPVTGKIEFVDPVSVNGIHTVVRMQFVKLRDCEYLGVTASRDDQQVDFEPVSESKPITVPTGERISREWRLDTTDLAGLSVRFVHRCNPFWTTITVAYP